MVHLFRAPLSGGRPKITRCATSLGRFERLILALEVSAACLIATPAQTQERAPAAQPAFVGLLRVRDLTPFGFLRLDMRQSPATFSALRTPSVEVDLGYQNTWTLSHDVEQYLRSRPRGPLTQADVAALRAMPGEQYLVDGELALLDVALNYPLNNRLGLYAVLSAAGYTGGFLDGAIESVHRTLGRQASGREGLTRNQSNVFFDLKGVQVTELDRSDQYGLLDPVLGLRYALAPTPTRFNVVLETALKIPLAHDGRFSTGRVDVGAQLTAQILDHRHAYYLSGALVYYSGSPMPFRGSRMIVPTAIVGYEYRWLSHTNFIAQLYGSRSTVRSDQTDLSQLHGDKYQLSLGVRHRLERGYWSFALTENIVNFNNTPDVGFQLGYGHAFDP